MTAINIYRPNSDILIWSFGTIYPASPTTHFDKVNEVTADEDESYIESTLNQEDFFTISNPDMPPTLPLGISRISSVKIYARAKYTSAGTRNLSLRFGATGRWVLAGTLTDSYAEYNIDYPLNPTTGLGWTLSDLEGAVIGVGTDTSNQRVTQVWVEITWELAYREEQPQFVLKSWLDSTGTDSKVVPDALVKRDGSDATFDAEFEMTETNLKQLFATEDLDLIFNVKRIRADPIVRGGQTIGYRHFVGVDVTAINKFAHGILTVEANEMIALGVKEVRRILREQKDTGGTVVESQESTAFQRPGSQLLFTDTIVVRYDKYTEKGVVTLTIQPDPDNPTWGSTDPAAGSYAHSVGDAVVVTAMPTMGHAFLRWVLDGYNHSENPITVLMDSSHVLYPIWTVAD